ncbi:prephenate dehydratase [Candidatus Micrarchaeota archaeon]|nr:prephenate dehydratase [Candidatus Micrarchaeota archaeon]
MNIAFLGPKGTFCHEAAEKLAGSASELEPFASIEDVFEAVENESVDAGVVPIENSVEGSVNSTLDCLASTNVKIIRELKLAVKQNLLALPGVELKSVRRIVSHPQALAQCRKFLKTIKAEHAEASSTAKACQTLDDESAAIASKLSAKIYGLTVLKEGVQDYAENATRFVLLSKKNESPTGKKCKTSIIFSVKHAPGALHEALKAFAVQEINLTKIESRPSRQKKWEYYFYVDFEGNCESEKAKKALKELEKHAKFVKTLGSYNEA